MGNKKIMEKQLTKEQMIVNRLSSDLSNLLGEFKSNSLNEENIFSYFTDILLSAEIDSILIVEVLEKTNNDNAIEVARWIKVNEGW